MAAVTCLINRGDDRLQFPMMSTHQGPSLKDPNIRRNQVDHQYANEAAAKRYNFRLKTAVLCACH